MHGAPPDGERERASSRLLTALTIFGVALAPRLAAAIVYAGEPVWDGHYYDFGAKRIAAGLGYSDDVIIGGVPVWHPWCHYPVGFSAFLGAVYRVFGSGPLVGPLFGAVVGALLAVATWALAGTFMTERRARIAGGLVALHPGLILYSALVMTEPLAALLTMAAFVVFARAPERSRTVALAGLVLGVATLVRPQALLLVPFMGVLHGVARVRASGASASPSAWLRASTIGLALTAATTLLPVLPWTARNCRVMDGCALVSTNGGWNLAIGAFPRATGRFETLRSSDGCREVTGQVQQDRCWLTYGTEQIRAHPGFWLSLIPKKLSFTFDHESFAVEYLHEAKPWQWPESRRASARELLTLVHRLLVAAAAFGVVAFVRRGGAGRMQIALIVSVAALIYDAGFGNATARFWPLVLFVSVVPWLPLPGRPPVPPGFLLVVAFIATTVVTHAIFFGEDRYHVVVTPALCLLAAAALRRPARAIRARGSSSTDGLLGVRELGA